MTSIGGEFIGQLADFIKIAVVLRVVRNFRNFFKFVFPTKRGRGSWPNTNLKKFDCHTKVCAYIVMRMAVRMATFCFVKIDLHALRNELLVEVLLGEKNNRKARQ